jgi:hypothetical protein
LFFLVACSSVEWVEENAKMLSSGGVVYLNVDMALDGNSSLRALGVPLTYQSLFDAAKAVPNPNPEEIQAGNPTVYETWVEKHPSDSDPTVPRYVDSRTPCTPRSSIIGQCP